MNTNLGGKHGPHSFLYFLAVKPNYMNKAVRLTCAMQGYPSSPSKWKGKEFQQNLLLCHLI